MKRRHFLGVAACGAFTPGILLGNKNDNTRLGWRCEVLETPPHNRAGRFPVVTDVALQPGGHLIAIVGDDHHVCIYDQKLGRYVEHLEKHTDWVRTAQFSPDGKILVTAGNDRQIYFWDTANWKTPWRFAPTVKRFWMPHFRRLETELPSSASKPQVGFTPIRACWFTH